jgi:hypothetical protein
MQFKSPSQPGWGPSEPEPGQQESFSQWQQQPSMYMPIPPAYTQPETYYPPQHQIPQQTVQPPIPRKELSQAKRYLIVSVIGMIIIIGGGLFWRSYDGGTQSTSSSVQSGTWTTTHTFSGNGIKQTEIFTISSDWQLQWTCDPSSFPIGSYNVQVFIYNADATLAGLAVNTICKDGNVGDSTELHQGGSIYLEINSEAAWTLTIQELQ